MDSDIMPPPAQPSNVVDNSFDRSVGRLRRHKQRKEQSGHNQTFVFKQLSALERKNKGIIAIYAKLRQYNSELERENYEFKQKQISLLVKNAAVKRKFKDLRIETERLTKKLEAKNKLLNRALWLREQLESFVTAIDSNQKDGNLLNTESPVSSQKENFNLNEDEKPVPYRENARLDSVTQRPRRVPRRDVDKKIDDKSDLESVASPDGVHLSRMPALSEKDEVFSEENDDDDCALDIPGRREAPKSQSEPYFDEIENSAFDDVLNECSDSFNLNISEDSEPINTSMTLTQNFEKEIVSSASNSSYIDISGNEGNFDETNQTSDVTIGENFEANLKDGVSEENVFSPANVLSDSSNNKHQGQLDTTPESMEKRNLSAARNSTKLSVRGHKKTEMNTKKKLVKSKNNSEILNKTSSYDFLSCSNDSFLLDEEKRIKLHDSVILNDENASPHRRTVRRRGKSAVSYAEPSLRAKLRRGDKISDGSLYDSPRRTLNKKLKNQRV